MSYKYTLYYTQIENRYIGIYTSTPECRLSKSICKRASINKRASLTVKPIDKGFCKLCRTHAKKLAALTIFIITQLAVNKTVEMQCERYIIIPLVGYSVLVPASAKIKFFQSRKTEFNSLFVIFRANLL